MDSTNFSGSKILLVEDEESLAIGLEFNLQAEGYSVVRAADGREGLEFFEKENFNLVILDIMLPFFDGFAVAQKIREKSPQIPILMLTARAAPGDRVQGLQLGADDYLTKPFHLPELLLRVKGMFRRKQWYTETTRHQPIYRFGENMVNFSNLTAQAGKRSFQLTAQEAMLLKYFIDKQGEVVSRRELLENVWQINTEIETRTVDNFIVRLRKYFEPNPAKPIFFISIRSAGYLFSENGESKIS
jgi:DNA-binding response OmpR family regulator